MKNKILPILLSILMSMFGAKSFAYDISVANADGVTIYYTWTNYNTELAVTSSGNSSSYSGDVVIPEAVEYDGSTYCVTSIGDYAFDRCDKLTSVTIGKKVTSIGRSAFYLCKSLASITIPNSVTSIGGDAFGYCSSLTTIEIPNGVTEIFGAFRGCNGLTSVKIPNSVTYIGNYAFSSCSGLTSVEIPSSVKTIESEAFDGCMGLTSITIPNSVTSIGSYAFSSCRGLTSVTISNKVTSIETGVFSGCSGLTSITIPNGVTTIGSYAFEKCNNLTSITIPNGVTTIGSYAFQNCNNLTSITIPNSVTSIGEKAFDGCSSFNSVHITDLEAWCKISFEKKYSFSTVGNPLNYAHHLYMNGEEVKNLTIPSSVVSISDYAFSGCSELTSLTIPNSVTSIGNNAFDGCSGLTSLTIGNSVTSIGNCAFYDCRGVTSIEIPNSVTSIGDQAFFRCRGLTSLTIGNNVTSIGSYAFNGCSGLTSITIPKSVTSIGNFAFSYCSGLTTVVSEIETPFTIVDNVFNDSSKDFYAIIPLLVPDGKESIYRSTEGWKKFSYIYEIGQVGKIGQDFVSEGLHFQIGENNTVSVISKSPIYSGDIVIPSQVNFIGNNYNVNSIAQDAFSDCSGLTSITIPYSVTSIGDRAFNGCSSLATIVSEIESPFAISDNVFALYEATMIVPVGKESIYQSTAGWNKFTRVFEVGQGGKTGQDFVSEDLHYQIGENNTVSVISRSPIYSGDIVIPSQVTFNGCSYDVTAIAQDAFRSCSGLTSVAIPNSVTSIGNSAFYSCSSLTSIEIPNSMTNIGSYTFSGCRGLTSITIPNGVASIGKYAFWGCSGLTSVTIPSSVTSFGEEAFKGCSSLNSVHIMDLEAWCKISFEANSGVETVGNPLYYAHHLYMSGEEIKDLVIPNGVTSVAEYAFAGCSDLTSVTIPNSVTTIGEMAFYYCSNLNSVHITDLDAWCKITFKNSNPLEYAHHLFMSGEEIKDLVIPNGVTSIGEYAFSGCSDLTSVTIPGSITSIGYRAFLNCSSLNSVHITDLDAWCKITFKYDSNPLVFAHHLYMNGEVIKDLVIPNSVTSIGAYAFSGCSDLTSVTIPSSITSIGDDAFSGCSGLTSVHITDLEAWCNISFPKIMWNQSCYNKANPLCIAQHLYMNGEEIKDLVIPNSVTSIGSYTFNNCRGLTSIDIPNSVTKIGDLAFAVCMGLKSVTIPNSVTSIGDLAFYGCTGLTSVTIGKNVNSIPIYAFAECTNLVDVNCLAVNVPSIHNKTFDESTYQNATLHVPAASLGSYKGTDSWKNFKDFVSLKCAYPTIKYENNKISFSCETKDVEFHFSIFDNNSCIGVGSSVSYSPSVNISVYATKDSYLDSDTAIKDIELPLGVIGDLNIDGKVNVADHVKLSEIIKDHKKEMIQDEQ